MKTKGSEMDWVYKTETNLETIYGVQDRHGNWVLAKDGVPIHKIVPKEFSKPTQHTYIMPPKKSTVVAVALAAASSGAALGHFFL